MTVWYAGAYAPAYQYQLSHKHSCISWWWAHSCPKHVEIDKYTESKLYTKLALFTRLYRDARSTKHKIWYLNLYIGTEPILHLSKRNTWCICEEGWPSGFNALFYHHCCFNSVWYTKSLWNNRNIPSQLNTEYLLCWCHGRVLCYYDTSFGFHLLHNQQCYILKTTAFRTQNVCV